MAKLKQLEMHNDKTIFIVMGEKVNVIKVKKEISENPIYFDNFITKQKDWG